MGGRHHPQVCAAGVAGGAAGRLVQLELREYTHARAGTHFELSELLRRAPLHKVLLVVGPHEKLPQIQAGIADIWRSVAHLRPATAQPASLNIVQIGAGSDAEMWGLFRAAAGAATANDGVHPAAP